MNKPLIYVTINVFFILASVVASAHQEGRNLFYWFIFLLNTNLLIRFALKVYPQPNESKSKRILAFIYIIVLILFQVLLFFAFVTLNFRLFPLVIPLFVSAKIIFNNK